jgi:DNA-directed RNA polymerase specialized sigma24 family protein
MESAEFASFLAALRQRDRDAGEQLDRLYRPFLCKVIHPWLADPKMRRAADSVDLCQTVLLKFLAAVEAGRYPDLQADEHLRRILAHIAKNAFRDLRRHARHPVHPTPLPRDGALDVADGASTPSQHVARKELEQLFLARLSERSRRIRSWRSSGWQWAEIGAALGQAANTVRIRYERECQRVAAELGLAEGHELE